MAGMEKPANRFIIAEECQAIFHVWFSYMLSFRLSSKNIQEGNFFGLLTSFCTEVMLNQFPLEAFSGSPFVCPPRCSGALCWHFSPVLSRGSRWITCWCYTWPKRLQIVEPSSGCIRILPGSWKSARLCKALKRCELLGLSLASLILAGMGVGFFPLMVLPKFLTWEPVPWRMPKAKGVKC